MGRRGKATLARLSNLQKLNSFSSGTHANIRLGLPHLNELESCHHDQGRSVGSSVPKGDDSDDPFNSSDESLDYGSEAGCGNNEQEMESETWMESDLEAFRKKLQLAHDAACAREREREKAVKRKVPKHYMGNSVRSRQVRAKRRREFVATGGVLITDFFRANTLKKGDSESDIGSGGDSSREDMVRDKA
jgi:hypothetical protein